jgi:hypothetical protein
VNMQDMECPVPCRKCKRWVELDAVKHAPNCLACKPGRGCDNLICPKCFKAAEAKQPKGNGR